MPPETLVKPLFFLILFVCTGPAFGTPVPCVNGDLTSAQMAQNDAKGTLTSVVNFLNGNDQKSQQLVLRWFGKNDQNTVATVVSVLSRTSNWVANVSLYCLYQNDGTLTDPGTAPDGSIILTDTSGDLYAYVDPGDLTKINLGLRFFNAPAVGMNSKLGAIIHEVTHFFLTGNTDDIKYGKSDCLQLAQQDPNSALKNADNYEYFVEEWMAQ